MITNIESEILFFVQPHFEGVQYFEDLFKDLVGCLIQVILEVLSKFPQVFSKEMNNYLEEDASEVKVDATLFIM